ncbi:MAG: hypothetical protein LBP42_08105, partial [Treponema sp.]|nr:hypothetical protein [Treponema sp.]
DGDADGEELEIPLHEEEIQDPPTEEPVELEEEDFSPVIPEAFTFDGEDAPEDLEDAALFPAEEEIPAGEENLFEETGPVEEADSEKETAEPAEQIDESQISSIPSNLQQELKTVLVYMDQLLESLPEDKIEEFAKSEYFNTYKKLFKELGLV